MEIPSGQMPPSDPKIIPILSSEIIPAQNSKDYLAHFEARTKKLQQEYFPDTGIVMLNHSGKPDRFTLAREFLHNTAEIPQVELDAIFTPEGALKPFEGEKINLENISAFELAEILTERTKPFYDMVNRSLDTSLPNGFNRHGLEHIDRVLERAAMYLQDATKDPSDLKEQMKLLVLEVFGHDLGNIFSRVNHPTLSMKLLDHIVPELQNYQHRDRIHTGILLHEEPVLKELAENVWQTGNYDENGKFVVDVDMTAEAMSTKFEPEWLALIRADKFDFGRERVTESLKSPRALAEDPHTRVNLLMETTLAERVDNTFTLELTYDHYLSPEEEAKFQAVSHATKHTRRGQQRVYATDEMRRAYKAGQLTHSEFIEKDFWRIYEGRLRIAMAATFAQDSTIDAFRVVVVDDDIPNILPEKGNLKHRERIFEKGHAEDGFAQLLKAA